MHSPSNFSSPPLKSRPRDPHDILHRICRVDVMKLPIPVLVRERALRTLQLSGTADKDALAQRAWSLRRHLCGLLDTQPQKGTTYDDQILERVAAYQLLLTTSGQTGTVATFMEQQLSRHADEAASINGAYTEGTKLVASIDECNARHMATLAKFFLHRADEDPWLQDEHAAAQAEEMELRLKLEKLRQEHPEVAAILKADEIRRFVDEFAHSGYMSLPSRTDYLTEILRGIAMGNHMVRLTGESATGKNVLARQVAHVIGTGLFEYTANRDEPIDSLIWSPGFDQKSTVHFGALVQAMTGLTGPDQGSPSHTGQGFAFHEFNKLSGADQVHISKFVAAAQPGAMIDIRSNPPCRVRVQPNFFFIVSGNPPGDRYTDRTQTPIEAEREFRTDVTIDYFPQTPEHPELFSAFVAALTDPNTYQLACIGRNDVQPQFIANATTNVPELNQTPASGGFLWRFASAMRSVLSAFSHQETALTKMYTSLPPEQFHLNSLFLDPGMILQWLREFRMDLRAQKRGIASFIVGKLRAYLDKRTEASAEEMKLFCEYFEYFGIPVDPGSKQTIDPKAPHTILTPKEFGLLFPDVPRPKEKTPTPKAEGEDLVLSNNEAVVILTMPLKRGELYTLEPGMTFAITIGETPTVVTYLGLVKGDDRIVVRHESETIAVAITAINDLATMCHRVGQQAERLKTISAKAGSPPAGNNPPAPTVKVGGATNTPCGIGAAEMLCCAHQRQFFGPEDTFGIADPHHPIDALPTPPVVEELLKHGFDLRWWPGDTSLADKTLLGLETYLSAKRTPPTNALIKPMQGCDHWMQANIQMFSQSSIVPPHWMFVPRASESGSTNFGRCFQAIMDEIARISTPILVVQLQHLCRSWNALTGGNALSTHALPMHLQSLLPSPAELLLFNEQSKRLPNRPPFCDAHNIIWTRVNDNSNRTVRVTGFAEGGIQLAPYDARIGGGVPLGFFVLHYNPKTAKFNDF